MKKGDKGCLWAFAIVVAWLVVITIPSARPGKYQASPKSLFMLNAFGVITLALFIAVILHHEMSLRRSLREARDPDSMEGHAEDLVEDDFTKRKVARLRSLRSGLLTVASSIIIWASARLPGFSVGYFVMWTGIAIWFVSLWMCLASGIEAGVLTWKIRKGRN